MKEEELGTNTTQLAEAEFRNAPKALDPVAVVLAAGKLVFMVMNALVFIALKSKPS